MTSTLKKNEQKKDGTGSCVWEATIPSFPFDEARVWKVVASAGCGKSFEIRRAIRDLIEKKGVPPQKIMYLVYNKKPALEFVKELGLAKGTEWIGTHHSVARRLMGVRTQNILSGKRLHEWGKEHGFVFSGGEDEDFAETEWDKVLSSLDKKLYSGIQKLDPYETRLLNGLKISEAAEGVFTHTRYLVNCCQLGRFPKDVEYVFVDEAQDNGLVQFEYFQQVLGLAQVKGLMIVGDDKQAINGYKGGVWRSFMEFPAERYVCLPTTYRNAPAILAFANRIAAPIRHRSPLTEESACTEKGAVRERGDFAEALFDIRDAIARGKSVMVLSRTGVYRDMAIEQLRAANIPVKSPIVDTVVAVVRRMRELSLKEDWTYDDIKSLFSVEEQPKDGEIKKLAYAKRGVLTQFLQEDYSLEDNADLYVDYLGMKSGEYPFFPEAFGFSGQLREDILKARDWTIPRGIWKGVPDERIASIESILKRFGDSFPSVTVSNIHPIKGAEADMVVLLRDIPRIVEDTEQSNPDDERRVWYVGATRARTSLVLTNINAPSPRSRSTRLF